MVLVTGGAGYIGSHTCVELLNEGYDVIIADNLSNSSKHAIERIKDITGRIPQFVYTELTDYQSTEALFLEYPNIDTIIHFAGLKSVPESSAKPLEYYDNNLNSLIVLLKNMRKLDINNLIFSSSATVYGDIEIPYKESMQTLPPTSPYGSTKYMIERILDDYCIANPKFNAIKLRYFNPVGAHPSGLIGEDPNGIPNNLMPYIAQVAVGKLEKLRITGNDFDTPDGTGVRDYIHVVDLAKGHVAALKKIGSLRTNCEAINLGSGKGVSVLELFRAYEKACGKVLPFEYAPRRPGDLPEYYGDTSKAERELDWTAKLGIDEMCASSWNWQSKNPDGYPK